MKKALVVQGGWQGHEPKECSGVIGDWLRQNGFDVNEADSLDALLDMEELNSCDVVIPCWTMGSISKEQCDNLCAAVCGGVGLAGWHGGMCDAFRNNTEYQFMTGGQFVAHPGNIIKYKVEIADPDDPIMRGVENFEVESEQYYMHVDPGNNVLATTTFSGEHAGVDWIKGTVMPVVWTRMYGAGRVFYSALGHVAKEFSVPQVMQIMTRGILWSCRGRVAPTAISGKP